MSDEAPKVDVVEPVAPVVVDKKVSVTDLSTIVSQINLDDVKTLDVKKLREGLLQSIYLLEHCLFSQAGLEYNRIGMQRQLLGALESVLFTEEEIKRMDQVTKLRVYELQTKNLQMSLQFLQGLHKESTAGLETLNNIEKVKLDKPAAKAVSTIDRVKLDAIKQMVEQKIKLKIQEKKEVNDKG